MVFHLKSITEKYKIMAEKTRFFILTRCRTFPSDWSWQAVDNLLKSMQSTKTIFGGIFLWTGKICHVGSCWLWKVDLSFPSYRNGKSSIHSKFWLRDLGLPEENLLNTDSPSYLRCLRVLCGQSSSFLNNNMILCKTKSQNKGVFWRTFVAQEARNCFSSWGKGTTGKLSCTLLW